MNRCGLCSAAPPMPDLPMSEKSELRDRFRRLRRAMPETECEDRSRRIVERVRALPEFEAARMIHAYWPAAEDHEVDTRPLIRDALARGTHIVLPVVKIFDRSSPGPRLSHVAYTAGMEMRPNRWGILEPVEQVPARVDAIDLILVPALACDVQGNRLGHGYGYYDEFLAETTAPGVCLCMDAFVVERLPVARHDRPVDILVTETRTLRTPDL